jgi:hypothetical protein
MVRRIAAITAAVAALAAAPVALAGNVGWSVSFGAPGVGFRYVQPAHGHGWGATRVFVPPYAYAQAYVPYRPGFVPYAPRVVYRPPVAYPVAYRAAYGPYRGHY